MCVIVRRPQTLAARVEGRAQSTRRDVRAERAAGCEQSARWLPEPQATTHIEQLNTQEMVAYKPADSCVAS